MNNKFALISGLLGATSVVVLTVAGGWNFPGYSHTSQYISELGAFGAPHAGIVNFLGFVPAGILTTAFVFFAWRALPRTSSTAVAMIGLLLFAVGYLAAAFFPCQAGCRPLQPSLSQVIHNILGLAGYVTAPLTLFILGREARSWPNAGHLAPIGFVGSGLALAGLLFLDPDFEYVGIAQRVLEASVLAWVVACAFYINTLSPMKA